MRWPSRRTSAPEGGFSTAELVIASGVLLLAVTAMLTSFTVAQRTTVRHEARDRVTGELRQVMQRMTKEIRQSSVVNPGSGPSVLVINTYVNGVATQVTYTASGTTLTRSAAGTTRVILERLTSVLVFSYMPTTQDPSAVVVSLKVRPERFTNDPGRYELASEIQMRNRARV